MPVKYFIKEIIKNGFGVIGNKKTKP